MSLTRRDFIKDAAIAGIIVTSGTSKSEENAHAGIIYEDIQLDETKRCPYFDQPLLCNGMVQNGKLLCES